MIWLVIPIPGIMYFYRPFATNYLWAFTITLALFVPYRLALAGDSAPRAAVARADHARARLDRRHVQRAHRPDRDGRDGRRSSTSRGAAPAPRVDDRRRGRALHRLSDAVLRARPERALRRASRRATRRSSCSPSAASPAASRSCATSCASRGSASSCSSPRVVRYVVTRYARGERSRGRRASRARRRRRARRRSGAIVVTLFVSPTATDRVFFASGVLLVAAFAIVRAAPVRRARRAALRDRRVHRRVRLSRRAVRRDLDRASRPRTRSGSRSSRPRRPARVAVVPPYDPRAALALAPRR